MKKVLAKVLEVIFGGIGGVILTLVFQYFFVQPQSFTFFLNGQEVVVTEEKYTEIFQYNDDLQRELEKSKKQYTDLKNQYVELENENNELSKKYNTENTQLTREIESLRDQINNMVDVQLKDMGLSIDGEIIPINSSESLAVINNRTYYSEEVLKNLISNNTNMTIQDNTMYIGRIIKESSYLLDEWVVDSKSVSNVNNITDSLGNTHINALLFSQNGQIIYNLKNEYSLIKFKLALDGKSYLEFEGILTIKADDKIVYTSDTLTKTNAYYDVVDIAIENCSLLTIEFNYSSSRGYCIMSDIIIYN